jgi:hypothetical protein
LLTAVVDDDSHEVYGAGTAPPHEQVDTVLSAIRARGQRAFITIPTKYLHRRIPHNVRHSNIPKARSGAHRALEEHEADLIKVRACVLVGGPLAAMVCTCDVAET